MTNHKSNTERLVIVAILIAMEVILTRFVAISTPMVRIGFGFLPMVLVAICYGPLWAGGAYALADFIGSMLFPSGAYFPGFTLSAFISGVIYGLILYRHKVTWKNTLLAVILVLLGVNLLVNTAWITIIVGKGYLALLPARFIKELICIPIDTALILVVNKIAERTLRPAV
jgi:ECF transporter S component (folate family)